MGYRIFFFCHSAGLLDRDLHNAFCEAGAEVHMEEINFFHTPEGHLAEAYNFEDIAQKIRNFRPDFVFSIEGHGQDIEGTFSRMYAILGIPYVTWFADEPPLVDGWGNRYCPENSLFLIFDEAYMPDVRTLGFSNIEVLPLGTNTKRWSIEVEGHDKKPFAVENISFVGKLATNQVKYLIDNLKNYWPELEPEIIDSATNNFINHTNKGIEWALEKNLSVNGRVLSRPSEVAWKLAGSLIERKASLVNQVNHISELLSLGIAVYGDDEWKSYIDPKYVRETIDYYGQQIRDVYRFSKINLNISKFQLLTTVNQRVFDVPAASGFLLTDFRPKLEDFFAIDKEELKRKSIYYLEHEKERLRVIERAKERILKEHDYSLRIKKLLLWVARLRCSELYRRFADNIKTDKNFEAVRKNLSLTEETDNTDRLLKTV
ncbi:MAG: hypothetical protein D4R45_03325 [Planctomycetaceae bacterium]|nr:MAG: hypothetical protein D4R45_03325 [Planctomycetaceae bacterium]